MDQSQHICRGSLDDFRACLQCGVNQINCKGCFEIKHKTDGKKHKSQNLRQSDVYQQFLKFINLEWLTGEFLLKGILSFQFSRDDMKTYMTSSIFYESVFFSEVFKDENVRYEYKILKSLSEGQTCEFMSLEHVQRILNDGQTNDMILNYVSGLLNENEEERIMLSHLDYFNHAHISQIQLFFERQQQLFALFLTRLTQQVDNSIGDQEKKFLQKIQGVFTVENYIKWREHIIKQERDPINYTKQFTAFLFDYYKRQASEKGIFTLRDYFHNYWQNFQTCLQVTSHLKEFIEEQIRLFKGYQAEMKVSAFKITYLSYKVWKMNYIQTDQLTYLKNHYFLDQFLEGYLRMLIEQSYLFLTEDERQEANKEHWTDYVRYIKDYCLFTEDDGIFFDFRSYKIYYLFRKRLAGFTKVIQKDKLYSYNEDWVRRFFDNQFLNQIKKINLEVYHEFIKRILEEEQKKKQERKITIQNLLVLLKQEQKQGFYEFIFLNFINFCQQKELKIKKDTYIEFKKRLLETMDEKYIQETEQRFQRGDYNQVEVEYQGQDTEQVKVTETISESDGHKVKIIEGINREEERILVNNEVQGQQSEDEEDIQMCLCCHGNPYSCPNQECQIIGYCTMCCL